MKAEPQIQPSRYIHGTAPEEQQRLSLLNDVLNQESLRELNIRGGERILEVGSGLGQFARMMAKEAISRSGQSCAVLGIERDPEQLSQARQLAEGDDESDLVEFRRGDALDLPLSQQEWGSFDIAHARFVLEHISQPGQVVKQMARAVRPGGRVVVSDDDHDGFRLWPEPPGFYALWGAYVRSYDRAGNDPYVGRRLVSLLHQAGLQSVRNTGIFFGSCAGNEAFDAMVDNVTGVIQSAREEMIASELLDKITFEQGIAALDRWRKLPDAALWYTLCWAEGKSPE